MFKDEMNTLIIKQFTALNPKWYSLTKSTLEEMARGYPSLYKYYDDKKDKILADVNIKKGKGAPKVVIRNEDCHKNYDDVIKIMMIIVIQ